ncbi:MAG: beta-lactamase family protein [Armatimonadetes bacterium]|nr:beta-lactamase family protein [Armatimonadota bacterium]
MHRIPLSRPAGAGSWLAARTRRALGLVTARARRVPALGLSAAVLMALALAPPAAAPAPPPVRPGRPAPGTLARVEAYVAGEIARGGIPGGSLAVVHGKEIVLARGFGSITPGGVVRVTPETPYQIASLTKSITSAAILQLREQGRIDLDAPVRRYLPWFALADEDASARITIRHLLEQTSGIPFRASAQVVWRDPRAIRPSLERGVRELRTVRPIARPGAAWQYANFNYAILGSVVEAVSGETYPRYVATRIFAPLGMTRSTFDLAEATAWKRAPSYVPLFGRWREVALVDETWHAPAGTTIFSTAQDMARYAAAWLGAADAPFLTARSLAAAQTGGPVPVLPPYWDGTTRYALGWEHATMDGTKVVWHFGVAVGHRAALFLLPERRVGIVLFLGADTDLLWSTARGAASLLLGREPPARSDDLRRQLSWAMLWCGLVGAALVAWLGVAVTRRRGQSTASSAWFAVPRAIVLVLLAALLIAYPLWILPAAQPITFPLFFAAGLRGWPYDVVTGYGLLACGVALWATYSLLAVRRLARRRLSHGDSGP